MAIEARDQERFESAQVSKRGVILSALGYLGLLGFAIAMLQAVYYRQVPVQRYPAPEEFLQPRIETGQRQEWHRLQAEQTKRLTTYGWVDRQQGLVQIPIERAMQILAAEGPQAYAPLAPAQALSSPSAGAERLLTPQTGVSPPAGAGASSGSAASARRNAPPASETRP